MALAEWFAAETDAYAALVPDDGENRTAALSAHHLLRLLGKRRFARGLALGPGSGGDYRGLAGRVKGWVAIEPARGFWTGELAGAPAEFRAPDLDGALDLPDAACDLAASFGALHHIANVSAVVGEIARVLAPGAPFLIREPIALLGDFRGPRRGVTMHERGVPHRVMDRILANAGFTIAHKSFANFPGVRELAWKLGVGFPWNDAGTVRLDAVLSRLMAFNAGYWRSGLWGRLAPRSCHWLAIRRA